ncbi:MAG: hypothetical protein QM796_09305 [Chthoniobacteraceae bacterium]
MLVLPSGRLGLVGRIGPRVAVMEIEQELHACRSDSAGHRQRMPEVAVALWRIAACSLWIMEDTQPHPIEPVLVQQVEEIVRRPVGGEFHPACFALGRARKIGSEQVVIRVSFSGQQKAGSEKDRAERGKLHAASMAGIFPRERIDSITLSG